MRFKTLQGTYFYVVGNVARVPYFFEFMSHYLNPRRRYRVKVSHHFRLKYVFADGVRNSIFVSFNLFYELSAAGVSGAYG